MAKLTVSGVADDAFLEAWRSERRRAVRTSDKQLCADARKLIDALDDELRVLLQAFWHKGRKVYTPWTIYELIERTKMTKADVDFNISRLIHMRAVKALAHHSKLSINQRMLIYKLTDIGKDIASEERQIGSGIADHTNPTNLVAARKVLRLDVRKMSARLCVETQELIAMEKGLMPITKEISEIVSKELKRPRSFDE